MEIVRFVKWWWTKSISRADRFIIGYFISAMTFTVSLFVFGPITFLGVLGLILVWMVVYITRFVYSSIKDNWNSYKIYKEREANTIVDVLAGRTRK